MLRRVSVIVIALALASPALAEDPKPGSPEAKAKAMELLKELTKKGTDTAKGRELAEKAEALDPEGVECNNALAWFYDIKLGDGDRAMKHYDRAIQGLIGATEDGKKRWKAELMAKKAT